VDSIVDGATVVAVDQGKSGTRAEASVASGARVHSAAPVSARGSEPGSTGVDAVVDAVAGLRLPRRPNVVSVGTTAAPATQEERHELAAILRDRLGVEQVLVTEDAVTAHLGAFRDAAGVVVSAGTGAIALWSDGRTCARIDGWGPYLGDHGSGSAIGRAGLRAAFSAADGRGAATSLMEAARVHLGGLGLDAARRLQAAANPTEIISAFAVAVLRAAEDGDPIASSITARAADDLATSAALAARPALAAGVRTVCCVVGQLIQSTALRTAFTERATQLGLVVGEPKGGAMAGAMALATSGPPPAFEPLVGVAGAAQPANPVRALR
jgi:N-acetylglucosamine kinase-like BadF-type ATPase